MVHAIQPTSPFAVFHNRNFAILWLCGFIDTVGSSLTGLAASIAVYKLTGSAASVGGMLIVTALPPVLIGLFAGVIVDRYDRRRIIIAAEVVYSLLCLSLPLLLPLGVAALYIVVFLINCCDQFFTPASESLLADIASERELAAANSFMQVSSVGAATLGFALAGFLINVMAIEQIFLLDALSCAIAIAGLTLIRAPALTPVDSSAQAVLHNLRNGVRFVFGTQSLRSLMVIILIMSAMFGLHNAILLPFSFTALGASEFEYGLIESAFSVGFVLGCMLMANFIDRLHEGQWIALGTVGLALVSMAFTQTRSVGPALVLYGLIAFVNTPMFVGRKLLVQRNTPRDMRGRVLGVFSVARNVAQLLGMLAAGLADVMDIRLLYLMGSLLLLGCGIAAFFLPGIGQPTAEWRRFRTMLRTASGASRLGLGRIATLRDFDLLARHLAPFAQLSPIERRELASKTRIYDTPPATAVVAQGEKSDAAYFVLAGRTVATRISANHTPQVLETHNPGDFFGEIAALTAAPRTANVLTETQTTLLEMPAETLKQMMQAEPLQRAVLDKMSERLRRLNLSDMPGLNNLDPRLLRELRQPQPEAMSTA